MGKCISVHSQKQITERLHANMPGIETASEAILAPRGLARDNTTAGCNHAGNHYMPRQDYINGLIN